MKKLLTIASIALLSVLLLTGCTATKIKYKRDDKGKVEYSIWHNGHWLKTEAEVLSGGMSQDGQFTIGLQGYKNSPSEEFNKTMQTYTGALVLLARLAAACYSPGTASIPLTTEAADPEAVAKITAAQSAANVAKIAAQTDAQVRLAAAKTQTTNAVECVGGSCLK